MRVSNKFMLIVASALSFAFINAHAKVEIKGNNKQTVKVQGAVANTVVGAGSKATQNLSSNKGDVKITGNNTQTTNVQGAVANTVVGAGSKAEQNLASNSGE